MTKQKTHWRDSAVLHALRFILIPTILFGLGTGLLTGEYVISFVTSLTISATLYTLYWLDWNLLRPRLKNLPRDRRLLLEVAFACLETILGALLAFFICGRVFGFDLQTNSVWFAIVLVFVLFLAARSIRYALEFYRDLREKEWQEEQLRTLATQAELKALKAQINPHFLFNTLNTIAQLIHTDPAQAEATVERLAEMFRYVLAGSERGLAPLEEELTFVDDYLEIERARFGERLRLTREVAPEALSVPVPSLILQPLVENAVRHGQGSDGSIDLTIHVRLHGNEVLIAIADHGPGMPPDYRADAGRGVGLRNVDERLRKTYGDECGLEIQDNEPQGVVVTIRIPTG
jgi:signal transduction histidine kinase